MIPSTKHHLIRVAVLCLLLSSEAYSQTDSCRFSAWVSGGLGVYSFAFTENGGIGGNFTLTVQYHQIRLKYNMKVQDQFAILGFQEGLRSHEFLVGYALDLAVSGRTRVALHAGLARTTYRREGRPIPSTSYLTQYEALTSTSTTFPLEVELERNFWHYFGGSIIVFVSLSEVQPLYGVNLCIRAGLL